MLPFPVARQNAHVPFCCTYEPAQSAIYNGRAVCFMKTLDYEEAERDLLEAFNKDAKNPDTLANLITCGLHLGKNVQRYIT